MSPRKQPEKLFNICVKNCMSLIGSACCAVNKSYNEKKFDDYRKQSFAIKRHLVSLLPSRLFEILCLERRNPGSPEIHPHFLTHHNMTIFSKCKFDHSVRQNFWIKNLPYFKRLIILDLMFICTDEILQVIGKHCLLLEQLNIVSKVDLCNCGFNASSLFKHVSDTGLNSIANLKKLRILFMDPPLNAKSRTRVGRCVSQAGIINLISKLPCLEELHIKTCDISEMLITSIPNKANITLGLKKIRSNCASAESIKKLVKICPNLKELLLVKTRDHNKDIFEQLTLSDLRLKSLDLIKFPYTKAIHKLLIFKGCYLTHFSLWVREYSLTIEDLVSIGVNCPNLISLTCMTELKYLNRLKYLKKPQKIYSKLKILKIGYDDYDILNILTFFIDCTNSLEDLTLKYKFDINIDDILINLIKADKLRSIVALKLDVTLQVSASVFKQLIQECDRLKMLSVQVVDMRVDDVIMYITKNNFNLIFDPPTV